MIPRIICTLSWRVATSPRQAPAARRAEYEGWSVDDLQTEADSRNLEVEGTGSNGKVLKKDLVAALEASDNPFIS